VSTTCRCDDASKGRVVSTAAQLERPAVLPSPRCDANFIDRCLTDLFQHWGEYRPIGRLYASHVPSFDRCCLAREAVDWGRKLGFDILGDRKRGYCVVGFRHPERVYLVKPGGEASTEPETQAPGQMTLAEAVE